MKTYKIRNKKNNNEMRLARRRMKNNKCVFVFETLSESFLLISLTDVTRVLIIGNPTNVKGYVLTADPEKYKYFPF